MKKLNLNNVKHPKTAAKKLCKWLKETGGWNAELVTPDSAKNNGWGNGWYVVCEECPYEGLVCLSLGGSVYAGEFGYYYPNGEYKEPEVLMCDNDNWIAEPYYSWALGFFKQ